MTVDKESFGGATLHGQVAGAVAALSAVVARFEVAAVHPLPEPGLKGREAGICTENTVITEERLTFTAPLNRVVTAAVPARRIRCSICAAAEASRANRKSA